MRFCMITTFYPPYNFGGDGIFVQRLAHELAGRGHQVEVVHCADSYRLLAGGRPAGEAAQHPNVTVHRLESPFGLLSPLATQQTGRPLFKARRLREILAQDFDVIHYHNISLVGGPQVLEYGRGIKLYTMHEYWLVCPTHTLFKYNRAPCTDPHCFTCSLVHKRPPQWWRYTGLLAAALRHVDAFVSPSPFAQTIHHQFGLDIPVVVLPHFVPAPAAPPADEPTEPPPALAHEQPYFLYVGRLEKIKGLHTLLPVFQRYPRARLLVAGTGNDEQGLRRMAAQAPNIRFLGRLTHGQLQPLYRQAAALIVPSICYEVSPLVIFEAFQQQTPVVVRNIGGMSLIVSESGGGFTYDTDADLVAALDRLVAEPGLSAELGQRGSQAFARRWTPDAHIEAYLQLIAGLAASRPAAAPGVRAPHAKQGPAPRLAD